jgi:hypothetical protein
LTYATNGIDLILKSDIVRTANTRVITIAILIVIMLHVAVALGLTFFPGQFTLGNSKVSRIYQYLVHLGPFYREEAIQTSPHLYVEVNGNTSDLIAMHLDNYYRKPWKINELTLRDNARRAADQFYRSRNKGKSTGATRLLKATAFALNPSVRDTVRWIYLHRRYIPAQNSWHNDTLFNYRMTWPE